MGIIHWIGIQIQCCMQTHCFKKTFNLIWIKFEKILNRRGHGAANEWARVKHERPLLRTIFFIHITCKTNAEDQHETKIYEHLQGPMKRARVNNLNQWSGWWRICAKQASSRSTIWSVVEDLGRAWVPESPLPTLDMFLHKDFAPQTRTGVDWLVHSPIRFEEVSGNSK